MKTIYESRFLAFYALIFCQYFQINEAQIVFLYEHSNKGGSSIRVRLDHCRNLPDDWMRKTSSMDTLDNCARLFSGKDCNGESIEILPHSPSHDELSKWRFDDTTRSTGPCRNSCNINITGISPLHSFDIQIYSKEDYEGTSKNLSVNGCTLIPEDFNEQIKSVKTNGYCIQLYDNQKCESDSKFYDSKSIELRIGTPYHDHLEKWNFKKIKAVSHCTFKCNLAKIVDSTTPISAKKSLHEFNRSETLNKSYVHKSRIEKETGSAHNHSLILKDYFPLFFLIPVLAGFVIFVMAAIIIIVKLIPRDNRMQSRTEEEMLDIRRLGHSSANESLHGNSVAQPPFKLNNT